MYKKFSIVVFVEEVCSIVVKENDFENRDW